MGSETSNLDGMPWAWSNVAMHPVKRRPLTRQGRQPLGSVDEVSEYLGVAAKTLRNWRSMGIGPRSTKIGGYIRYRWSDVDAFIEAQAS